MRVSGEWVSGEDDAVRPVVPGLVRLGNSNWLEVAFLLDGGGDRTGFNARFLNHLQGLEATDSPQILRAGVGGSTDSITVETAIAFIKGDGRVVSVRRFFGVFTEGESTDLSILGRDVTNNFAVIYDHPRRTIALLATPHFCEIKGGDYT